MGVLDPALQLSSTRPLPYIPLPQGRSAPKRLPVSRGPSSGRSLSVWGSLGFGFGPSGLGPVPWSFWAVWWPFWAVLGLCGSILGRTWPCWDRLAASWGLPDDILRLFWAVLWSFCSILSLLWAVLEVFRFLDELALVTFEIRYRCSCRG